VRLLPAWEMAERVLDPSLAATLSDWATLVLPSVAFCRSQHDRGRFSNIAWKSQIRIVRITGLALEARRSAPTPASAAQLS
jgi:hypothetical protein